MCKVWGKPSGIRWVRSKGLRFDDRQRVLQNLEIMVRRTLDTVSKAPAMPFQHIAPEKQTLGIGSLFKGS